MPMGWVEVAAVGKYGRRVWRVTARLAQPKPLNFAPLVQAFGYRIRSIAGPVYRHRSIFAADARPT